MIKREKCDIYRIGIFKNGWRSLGYYVIIREKSFCFVFNLEVVNSIVKKIR